MPAAPEPTLRRIALFALLSAAIAVAIKTVRDRRSTTLVSSAAAGTPQWPPFEPRLVPPVTEPSTSSAPAPVERPESWVGPTADGVPPADFPVKVKISSGIFHVQGGRFYDRTIADRHYASADAAEADGYRRSKS